MDSILIPFGSSAIIDNPPTVVNRPPCAANYIAITSGNQPHCRTIEYYANEQRGAFSKLHAVAGYARRALVDSHNKKMGLRKEFTRIINF